MSHRVSGRNRLVRHGTIRSCRAIYCCQASSTLTYSSWPARRQQSNSDSLSSCRSCACQRQFLAGSVPFYTLLWLLVTLLVSSLMLRQPRLLSQWPLPTLLPNLVMTLFERSGFRHLPSIRLARWPCGRPMVAHQISSM